MQRHPVEDSAPGSPPASLFLGFLAPLPNPAGSATTRYVPVRGLALAQPTSYPESAALQPANRADVTRQLTRVLESSAFHGSKRCQKFLQFAIDKALEGDVDSLKERTIAVEVFGRNADADLDHDSIVRVGAREVRKRLEHYYAT